MKHVVAVIILILTTGSALAASAPAFNKMSVDELQQYFAGKSFMHYDRRTGTNVSYFRANGTLYTAAAVAPKVNKTTWNVVLEPGHALICFFEVTGRLPQLNGAPFKSQLCAEAKQFVREAVDMQPGDVLGLAKRGKPSKALDFKKTTFARLKAAKP